MDTAVALMQPYAAPALAFGREPAETEDVVWWIIVVGFAYAVALAWATWCRHNGGSAEISLGRSAVLAAGVRGRNVGRPAGAGLPQ